MITDADKTVRTGYHWPLVLLVLSWPWRKLIPMANQLDDEGKAITAMVLCGILSIAAFVVDLVFTLESIDRRPLLGLAWLITAHGYVLWHVCRWLFTKEPT